EAGKSSETVLADLRAADPWPEHRQVAVLDRDGMVAVYTGRENKEWCGHAARRDLVAMGNYLRGPEVVDAMVDAHDALDPAEILEERLLAALEAGKAAGGERGGHYSAGLIVVAAGREYARTDLRVDWYEGVDGDDAVSELRRLFDRYRPLIPYY